MDARPDLAGTGTATAATRARVGDDAARRRLLWRLGLALSCVALLAVGMPVDVVTHAMHPAAAVPLSILLTASIPLALVAPRTAVAVHVVALGLRGLFAVDAPTWLPWPIAVTGILGLVLLIAVLASRDSWRVVVGAWASSTVISAALVAWGPVPRVTDGVGIVVVSASITAVAAGAAIVLQHERRARAALRAAQADAEAQSEQRRWAQERARIAREMHDVVAHSMSLVHMRATSAPYRLRDLPPDAVIELERIAEQARAALGEMRGLLGVLRQDGDGTRAPQPTLDGLDALVAETRDAGVRIAATIALPDPRPGAAAQLALYRVAQEALSNVVRHASTASVQLTVGVEGTELVLRVDDDGGVATVPAGGGHGIRGMRERMAGVDGRLVAGPDDAGGFSVLAAVPYGRMPT